MSGAAGHPSLRFCIAERLGVIGQEQRPVGRRLGVSGNTIGRWGSDPYAWGFHVVDMAVKDDDLRDALLAYLGVKKRLQGEAVRVRGDLFTTLTTCAALVQEVSKDLADGQIDRKERRRLLTLAKELHRILGERVIPDLEALHA